MRDDPPTRANPTADQPSPEAGRRVSGGGWIGRALVGVGLGVIWSQLVLTIWIALLVAMYGDIIMAFQAQQHDARARLTLSASVVSEMAAFVGAIYARLALGNATGLGRKPILLKSAWGAGLGALLGGIAGAVAEFSFPHFLYLI